MGRLIDANEILVLNNGTACTTARNLYYEQLQEQSDRDYVEVVRCKDCKYRFTNMGGWYKVCGLSDDCSCSLGERREDETN